MRAVRGNKANAYWIIIYLCKDPVNTICYTYYKIVIMIVFLIIIIILCYLLEKIMKHHTRTVAMRYMGGIIASSSSSSHATTTEYRARLCHRYLVFSFVRTVPCFSANSESNVRLLDEWASHLRNGGRKLMAQWNGNVANNISMLFPSVEGDDTFRAACGHRQYQLWHAVKWGAHAMNDGYYFWIAEKENMISLRCQKWPLKFVFSKMY